MKYHTVLISGFTSQNGTDSRANGGVTITEVARTAHGYRTRKTDSNGCHESSGRSHEIARSEVLALLALAVNRANSDERNGRCSRGYPERLEARLRAALRLDPISQGVA